MTNGCWARLVRAWYFPRRRSHLWRWCMRTMRRRRRGRRKRKTSSSGRCRPSGRTWIADGRRWAWKNGYVRQFLQSTIKKKIQEFYWPRKWSIFGKETHILGKNHIPRKLWIKLKLARVWKLYLKSVLPWVFFLFNHFGCWCHRRICDGCKFGSGMLTVKTSRYFPPNPIFNKVRGIQNNCKEVKIF